jgi:hypothetical protein
VTDVPGKFVALLKKAASATSIPYAVVAAQINLESGFNPDALSPTGAQGLAQFEPGTWASYGSGSPDDPSNAMAAYSKYMTTLLKQENGNLRNALAAYNAGPGNLQAGYGYADEILSAAKTGDVTVNDGSGATTTSSPGGLQAQWWDETSPALNFLTGGILKTFTGDATGVADVATTIGAIATELGTVTHWMTWMFAPANWLRVGAAGAGMVILIIGIVMIAKS